MMSGKSIAIVTGANGGLGKEFVKLLLKEENVSEIWAIARNEETLKRLSDEFGNKIRIFSVDLSSRASVDESLNMIDLNISAVVALSLTCIPYMNKDSRIINIASQASFFPLPYQNIYSSTKVFVRNYIRALNVE